MKIKRFQRNWLIFEIFPKTFPATHYFYYLFLNQLIKVSIKYGEFFLVFHFEQSMYTHADTWNCSIRNFDGLFSFHFSQNFPKFFTFCFWRELLQHCGENLPGNENKYGPSLFIQPQYTVLLDRNVKLLVTYFSKIA